MATGYERYPMLYGTRRWRKIRQLVLARDPICRICERSGRITPATIADHIKPHNGDLELFYDMDNLQGICASCHSGIKRVADLHGHSQTCDVDGFPLDNGHYWSK